MWYKVEIRRHVIAASCSDMEDLFEKLKVFHRLRERDGNLYEFEIFP